MPRISAPSNAAQRAETQRRILNAFGELLFTHGLPGLTMTDVARHAGIGRTAVYNYYADIEELLISYALVETERFLAELKESLNRLDNPVDRLALYVRAQVEDLSRRHLPPGPAMGAVLSPASFAKLADHVGGDGITRHAEHGPIFDDADRHRLPRHDLDAVSEQDPYLGDQRRHVVVPSRGGARVHGDHVGCLGCLPDGRHLLSDGLMSLHAGAASLDPRRRRRPDVGFGAQTLS